VRISSIGSSHPECTYDNLPSHGRWCSCFWATYRMGLLPGLLTYSDLTSSFGVEHQSGSPWPVIPATDTNYGGHRRCSSGQHTRKKALPDKLERTPSSGRIHVCTNSHPFALEVVEPVVPTRVLVRADGQQLHQFASSEAGSFAAINLLQTGVILTRSSANLVSFR
jgi:hypothetical protein